MHLGVLGLSFVLRDASIVFWGHSCRRGCAEQLSSITERQDKSYESTEAQGEPMEIPPYH
jgi:hypothetical protein